MTPLRDSWLDAACRTVLTEGYVRWFAQQPSHQQLHLLSRVPATVAGIRQEYDRIADYATKETGAGVQSTTLALMAAAGEIDMPDWAEAFLKCNPNCGLDEATMIVWFANALMRGYDEHAASLSRGAAGSEDK